jgi:TonB family protein
MNGGHGYYYVVDWLAETFSPSIPRAWADTSQQKEPEILFDFANEALIPAAGHRARDWELSRRRLPIAPEAITSHSLKFPARQADKDLVGKGLRIPTMPRWLPLLLFALTVALDAQMKVPEMDAKRAALEKPAPELPAVARQLKISGHVELSVTIDESGDVSAVKAETGNPILTAPCMAAVKKWKFKPFLQDGKAARAFTTLSFDFKQ